MRRPPRRWKQLVTPGEIVSHCMMGTLLGVLCGGLLLLAHTPWIASIADAPHSSRLIFLVAFGLSFGLGAAVTGVLFSIYENL